MIKAKSQASGTAVDATESQSLTKHLVLISKPVYMGVYVAVDATNRADAVARVCEALVDEASPVHDEQTLHEKLVDLFGEMRISAHGQVNYEHNGMVNAMSDSEFEVLGDSHHAELDIEGVLDPAAVEHRGEHGYRTVIAIDLTKTEAAV